MIRSNRQRRDGFTLVEVMVATVLIAVAVVALLGGIRSLGAAQSYARTGDLLQRLAEQKLGDVAILQDPTANGGSGDFSDRGYPDISWSLADNATSVTDLDQVTVTVTQGKQAESLATLMYIRPSTSTAGQGTTSTSTSGS